MKLFCKHEWEYKDNYYLNDRFFVKLYKVYICKKCNKIRRVLIDNYRDNADKVAEFKTNAIKLGYQPYVQYRINKMKEREID